MNTSASENKKEPAAKTSGETTTQQRRKSACEPSSSTSHQHVDVQQSLSHSDIAHTANEDTNHMSMTMTMNDTPSHEKEFTLESLANSNFLSSSMTSNGSNDDAMQPQEEMTLSSIFHNLTETLKKAKKQEKESKKLEEESASVTKKGHKDHANTTSNSDKLTIGNLISSCLSSSSSSSSSSTCGKDEIKQETKAAKTQKRPNSQVLATNSANARKGGRRVSADKPTSNSKKNKQSDDEVDSDDGNL